MSVLRTSLTGQQREVEERLRTVCLLLCGLAVVAAGLYYLKAILIPLVLAVSLMYILQPLIDFLTRRPLLCCGRRCCVQRPNLDGVPACLRPVAESCLLVRLPYWLAVCVALVVAYSVRTFSSKATEYTARVQLLARTLVSWLDDMQISWQHYMTSPRGSLAHANATAAAPLIDPARIEELAKKVPVGDMILSVLTSLVDVLSNLFLVLLFTVYLLLGSSPNHDAPGFGLLDDNERPAHDAGASSSCASSRVAPAPPERRNSAFGVSTSAHGDAAIRSYLKSKIGVSILVGLATAVSLAALGVDLWLVFGLLGFWLNFVPTVGTLVAVLLPMPVVLLDERFGPVQVVLALALPLAAHGFAGNVLEPMLFGSTLRLHPVVVLLSLMTWAALWGVTGMVLAVPITAVLRIRLAHIDSPTTQYLADLLAGGPEPGRPGAPGGGGGGGGAREGVEPVSELELARVALDAGATPNPRLRPAIPPPPPPPAASSKAAHPSAAGAEDQRTPLASAPPYQSLDLWASENV